MVVPVAAINSGSEELREREYRVEQAGPAPMVAALVGLPPAVAAAVPLEARVATAAMARTVPRLFQVLPAARLAQTAPMAPQDRAAGQAAAEAAAAP
jgi:hypothetical protein